MGVAVMILGESGTGKSTSLRNFAPDEISLINVDGKPLPFRGKFNSIVQTDDPERIIKLLLSAKKKTIIIDDFQFVMGNAFLKRAGEKSFDKFIEIGQGAFYIIETVKKLPPDVVVYFLNHTEVKDGITTCKTIGKMLDEKINFPSKFSIVLRTQVIDGEYYFSTHNSGADVVKTPLGMFEESLIENDLKLVNTTIRSYYDIGD